MKGTRITIEATSPFAFSTDAEKEHYAGWVTSVVQAHSATDVTVTVGDETEWISALGDSATAES